MVKTILSGAALTALTLFGGLILGFVAGNMVFDLLPGSSIDNPPLMHVTAAAAPALLGFLAGAAAWGAVMGRIAGRGNPRRMALAGALGFGPITLALALLLAAIEPPLIENFGHETGIHRIFTLLFVPSAALIAGVSAWAIGRGLGEPALARSLLWQVGLIGGAAFLVVNLGMEAAGWVVGGPGAGERFTMITVMSLGDIAAALAGGGWLGWRLVQPESG